MGGIPAQQALVAGADQVDRVGGGAGLGLEGLVNALGDIGRLLVDEAHNAAGVAVKAKLGAVVADAADDATGDFLYVDIGLGANLAGDNDGAGGHEGLAGAADVLHVGRHAVVGDVALLLELYFFGEDCDEDGVADLVSDLIVLSKTCPGDRYHSAGLYMQGHIIARKSNIHTLSAPTHWGQT